jgi:hypothetical protein
MLVRWASDNEENREKYSDLNLDGPPFECTLKIAPRVKHDRSGPILVLLSQKDVKKGWRFTIRVHAKSARMTYDIRLKEKGEYPQLEVRQWRVNHGNRVGEFEYRNSLPLLILDLIESRLPGEILDHEWSFFPVGTDCMKPCLGCGTLIDWEMIVCPACASRRNVGEQY